MFYNLLSLFSVFKFCLVIYYYVGWNFYLGISKYTYIFLCQINLVCNVKEIVKKNNINPLRSPISIQIFLKLACWVTELTPLLRLASQENDNNLNNYNNSTKWMSSPQLWRLHSDAAPLTMTSLIFLYIYFYTEFTITIFIPRDQ